MTIIVNKPQEIAVVSGVLNKYSIAYHIALAMLALGIKVIYLVQTIHIDRVRKLLGDDADIVSYDATNTELVFEGAKYIGETYGTVDYLVHAVAFSDKKQLEGSFLAMTKENFLKTMEISSFSFVEMCQAYKPYLTNGSSIITLTFLGSQFVAANYGVMGGAKASLESNMRYVAQELGALGIRVNAIAPGPVKTLAASGIDEFDLSLRMGAARSAFGRNATAEEVGRTSVKLMQCEGVTGEVLHVDYGTSQLVGMGTSDGEKAAYRSHYESQRAKAKAAKQAEAE